MTQIMSQCAIKKLALLDGALERFKKDVTDAKTSIIKGFGEQELEDIIKNSIGQAWGDTKRPHYGIGKFKKEKKMKPLGI